MSVLSSLLFCCRRLLIGTSLEALHLTASVSLYQHRTMICTTQLNFVISSAVVTQAHLLVCRISDVTRVLVLQKTNGLLMLGDEMIECFPLCRPCRGHYPPQHAGSVSLPTVWPSYQIALTHKRGSPVGIAGDKQSVIPSAVSRGSTVRHDSDSSRRLKERRKHWLWGSYLMCLSVCVWVCVCVCVCVCVSVCVCDAHAGWLPSFLCGRAALEHT